MALWPYNTLTKGRRPSDKKEKQSNSQGEPKTPKECKKTKARVPRTLIRKSGLQQSAFTLLN
jgi:hypothetical protein